jgi:hypothetical protein
LRVQVDQQDAFSFLRQIVGERHGGGGLADPAFLIGNANDFGGHGIISPFSASAQKQE